MKFFWNDQRGGVMAYGAIFAALAMGSTALAVDIGRMSVLRTQMQNHADAAAMAAAKQLDGKANARVRAEAMARDSIAAYSSIPSNGTELTVKDVNFYSEYDTIKTIAGSDLEAKFAEVVLVPKRVNMIFAPMLAMFSSGASDHSDMEALAVAGPKPYICHAPPLMICNMEEQDPLLSVDLPSNFGRQIVLKEPQAGQATWEPGNFGLLALPDGSSGASDIEAALAAVLPADCYTIDVLTATGSKTDKVKNGINSRFDLPGGLPYPAPNVITYPRDDDIAAGTATRMGNGSWDVAAWWAARHGGAALPIELTNATRYQVYLYEQGLSYARSLIYPGETLYPIPSDLSADFEVITPPGQNLAVDAAQPNNPDVDGVPSTTVASNGYARRVVKAAILNCIAENVQGHGEYPTNGQYVEMFITEYVKDPPDAAIYGEIIRPITSLTSPDFHANVRLVR